MIFSKSLKFPSNLRLVDITAIYKEKDPQAKENYRPLNVLPMLSKVLEKLMQKQMNSFITDYLSDFLCGYRQGFSTPHALITFLESYRQSGSALMNLSKTFDATNHEPFDRKTACIRF